MISIDVADVAMVRPEAPKGPHKPATPYSRPMARHGVTGVRYLVNCSGHGVRQMSAIDAVTYKGINSSPPRNLSQAIPPMTRQPSNVTMIPTNRFFYTSTPTSEFSTLSQHDALPI